MWMDILGVALIAATIWEVFNDLFQPSSTGALSDWIGRTLFDTFKRSPRLLPLAGPLAVIVEIGVWIVALMLGFALVFFDAYPAQFRMSTGDIPPASSPFLSVLYFSFETLITLGYGDIVPHSWAVRFVASTEALVGFGLLTASVSSIVLLYPALARMRLLARTVSHIVSAEQRSGVAMAASVPDTTLSALARDVTRARIDLIHFPIVYYFVSNDREARLATWVRDLERFARDGAAPERPAAVRVAAHALDEALSEFAALVDARFLHTGSRDRARIFAAFVGDQGR
jgi:hypothetical protein